MSCTAHLPAQQIAGPIIRSDDPRLPVGSSVGLRLADFGGVSEPSVTFQGTIHPILVLGQDRHPDGSSDVTFALLPAGE
ncbi:hypothetical protein DEIPH_ctg139orf0072 [Deinococcus phoenicis]|uniref:Uncharacterized protein n=1 Tax=Deinococcus phoenicis TaxID=1476583 RepID=A0A016QJK0_9DEIO|nr:hypothetical protein [Deinococcus phoenicis]EYB66350.1 hypothetical protein DEIPH_ctg139orf0072 [Deinococcus phoenicis]